MALDVLPKNYTENHFLILSSSKLKNFNEIFLLSNYFKFFKIGVILYDKWFATCKYDDDKRVYDFSSF